MARIFKRERAAATLADALFYGDKEACEKYGVSLESLYRWRRLIDTDNGSRPPIDSILTGYVAVNLRILQTQWLSKLPRALEATVEALERFASKKSHDPVEVSLLIESLKMQAQVQLANRLVDEQRIARGNPEDGCETPAVSRAGLKQIPPPADDTSSDSN